MWAYIDGLIQWASGWGLIIGNQLRAARASLANGWLAARARLWAIHNKPRLTPAPCRFSDRALVASRWAQLVPGSLADLRVT